MSIFNRLFRKNEQNEQRDFLPTSYSTYSPLTFRAEEDPVVSSCIDKIVNTLSVLPIRLYSHTKNGKVQAASHWLFSILENPAVEETATLFYSSMIKQLLYTGNAYIYLCRDSKGNIVTTKLVDSRRCRVSRTEDYHKIFTVDSKTYTERDILHIPYMSGYNGTVGTSPIELNKELINLHQMLLLYINNYFNNSVGSRLAIQFGDTWGNKPAEMEKLYSSIIPYLNKFVLSPNNAGKMMIPPPDTKIETIEQRSNIQAELSSLLVLVEKQIAQCFNVPYEIIDSSQSKYNSLEQKNLDFLQSCILPLGNHIAESYEKLLLPTDNNLFIEYSYSNMLKSDFKSTVEFISKEIQSGLMTINEGRAKLSLSAVQPEIGDVLFIPSNLLPLTKDNIESILAQSKLALEDINNKTDEHSPMGDNLN